MVSSYLIIVLLLVAVPLSRGMLNLPLGHSYDGGVELFINVSIGGRTIAVQVDSGSSTFVVPVAELDGGIPFCANGSQLCRLPHFAELFFLTRAYVAPDCVYGSYTPPNASSSQVKDCNTTVPASYTTVLHSALHTLCFANPFYALTSRGLCTAPLH